MRSWERQYLKALDVFVSDILHMLSSTKTWGIWWPNQYSNAEVLNHWSVDQCRAIGESVSGRKRKSANAFYFSFSLIGIHWFLFYCWDLITWRTPVSITMVPHRKIVPTMSQKWVKSKRVFFENMQTPNAESAVEPKTVKKKKAEFSLFWILSEIQGVLFKNVNLSLQILI